MTRIDIAKGTILQGVDLLQLWGNNRLMIGLDGQFRLAPVIDTVTLEFMAAKTTIYCCTKTTTRSSWKVPHDACNTAA